MPYVLGIDIGTGSTVVAVSRLHRGTWSEPQAVAVDTGSDIAGDVLRRVGDDVPLVLDGRPYHASTLTAEVVDEVVSRVEAAEGQPAEGVVVAVPGTWGPHRTGLLREALWRAGVDGRVGPDGVALLAAPVAAVEGYAAREPVGVGDTIAVYALGGTHCECSLVRRSGVADFELLAGAETGEPTGGADFDDVLLQWVRARLASDLDPADPQDRLALSVLRQRCTAAREELSATESTTVRALLPGGPTTVAVSRGEFEELIQPMVGTTVETLLGVVGPGPVPDAVLLVGGAARTPLVRRQVESAVAGPVRMGDDPAHSVALGAACAARRLVAAPDSVAAYRPAAAAGEGALSGVGDPGDPGAEPAYPPPRPPVVITALEAPRSRSARRAAGDRQPGARMALLALAVLLIIVGVWLTVASGLGRA